MTTVPDVVVAIHAALADANVPHAFGGALALAYHVAEPRGTRDVDVNIFVPAARAGEMLLRLPAEIRWTKRELAEIERDGQVRVFWDDTPVDLFFVTHPFHASAATHVEEVPFVDATIPILSANHLAVFKAFFNRTKDWADIEAMVDVDALDLHWIIGWLVDLLGADDERVERMRTLLRRPPPGPEPRFGS